jgi:hypothetical protein
MGGSLRRMAAEHPLDPALPPRFVRYHKMVSAPELWNREAVDEALHIHRGHLKRSLSRSA